MSDGKRIDGKATHRVQLGSVKLPCGDTVETVEFVLSTPMGDMSLHMSPGVAADMAVELSRIAHARKGALSMTPREVFDSMRPFYPHWPATFDEALRAASHGDSVAVICTAMARHPGRLRAWLDWKAPAASSADNELPFVVSRKRAPTLDWKMRAAGEKEND